MSFISNNGISSPYLVKTPRESRGSMLKEVEEEASKLVSAKFDDALWLMKASEELDKMKDQLNESSYKAKVLVLNAQILDRISCMDAISVRNDRILTLINKLDSTIKESDRLARTPALDHFQAYAKCLLFERIGDYLISRHSRAPNEYGITGEGDVTYGLGSYMLALNALLHSTPVTPRLAAVCARDILILHTILCNSSPDLISTAEKLINNKQIGEKLLNVLQKGQIGHSHALSYVSTVTSCVYTKKLGSSMEQYASKIWVLADNRKFLQMLVWLIAFNKDLRNSSMSFMDNFLQVLPDEPDSSSLQQIDERSLSRKDVKVLLIAYSKWISLEWESSAKYKTFNAIKMIPPPFVSALLPSAINKFWIALLQKLDDAKQSWNVSNSLIAISNCLELSRLRTKLPDIRIVNEMRCWLMKFGDKGNKWASHSCSIIIDLIEGKRNVSCKEMALSFGSGQTTISTDLEEEIYNDASLYLQQCENIIPNTADNNQVEQINEQSASQNGDGIGRIEVNDEENGDDSEQKPNDTPDNSHYSPSLLTRLEVAAKRAVSNTSNGCIAQNASSKSQRCIFNLRDFLQLREINKELKRYIDHDLSQNKQNGFSSALKNEEKDLGNVIMKNQQSFEQKLDGVVKMMQEMVNTTSTPSTSMPQAPIQMPSLHMQLPPMNFAYQQSLNALSSLNYPNSCTQSQSSLPNSFSANPQIGLFNYPNPNTPQQFIPPPPNAPQQFIPHPPPPNAPQQFIPPPPPNAPQQFIPPPPPNAPQQFIPPPNAPQQFIPPPNVPQQFIPPPINDYLLPNPSYSFVPPSNTDDDKPPHDPHQCLGCADEKVQDKAFQMFDFLADTFQP